MILAARGPVSENDDKALLNTCCTGSPLLFDHLLGSSLVHLEDMRHALYKVCVESRTAMAEKLISDRRTKLDECLIHVIETAGKEGHFYALDILISALENTKKLDVARARLTSLYRTWRASLHRDTIRTLERAYPELTSRA